MLGVSGVRSGLITANNDFMTALSGSQKPWVLPGAEQLPCGLCEI